MVCGRDELRNALCGDVYGDVYGNVIECGEDCDEESPCDERKRGRKTSNKFLE